MIADATTIGILICGEASMTLGYAHDALSRHVSRNADTFANTDAAGNVVAEYAYDAFGRTISRSGTMSDVFRHRFSTKYCDTETGLYYYGCRFYSPTLMRWLNRDPIEEDGGLNLYGFCGNNAVSRYDKDGRAYFAKRQLAGWPWSDAFSTNTVLDK